MPKKVEGKTQTNKKEIDRKLIFILEESIPKSQNDRKRYVSDICFFYSTIFKKKLEHFIGEQLLELSKIGRSEELNNIIRANINCFNLINTWMETMSNEHLGNLENIRDSFDENKEIINNIKNKYGKN